MLRQRGHTRRGGVGHCMENCLSWDVSDLGLELFKSHHFDVEVAMSPGHSQGCVEAPTTLDSIVTQLNNLHMSMETLREQH